MRPVLVLLAVASCASAQHFVAVGSSSSPLPDAFSDAHRRLYGIRRLRMLHPTYEAPAARDSAAVRSRVLRRQPAAPRAQLPPMYLTNHHPVSELRSEVTSSLPRTQREILASQFDNDRIQRMEARWKKLGINLENVKLPYSALHGKRKSSDPSELRIAPARTHTKIKQHFASHRPRIAGPLLRAIDEDNYEENHNNNDDGNGFGSAAAPPFSGGFGSGGGGTAPFSGGFGSPPSYPAKNHVEEPPSFMGDDEDDDDDDETSIDRDEEGEEDVEPDPPRALRFPVVVDAVTAPPTPGAYHSRTTPPQHHFQFAQQLAQRPRLHIRRPGEPRVAGIRNTDIASLPNFTPYMNNARQKFGYDKLEPSPFVYPPRTMPPPMPVTAPPAPPPTTTTTTTTTTMAPDETGDSGLGFGDSGIDGGAAFSAPSELPPEFANIGFGLSNDRGTNLELPAKKPENTGPKNAQPRPKRPRQRMPPTVPEDKNDDDDVADEDEEFVIPQNSGLRPVAPPKEFLEGGSGFGTGVGGSPFAGGSFGGGSAKPKPKPKPKGKAAGKRPKPRPRRPQPGGVDEGLASSTNAVRADSAFAHSKGPSGDGYGPSVPSGEAVPPLVPAVSVGGAAAGIPPPEYGEYGQPIFETTENPATTVKPSALLNVLNRADQGFNQAITHFENGSPVETAAIDILEVALGSQKLDSQAKLLGHVDRTLGLDNLQRLQRWANTAGALDMLKEQFVKIMQNYKPPEDLLPTIPPQLEYLFKPTGR